MDVDSADVIYSLRPYKNRAKYQRVSADLH